MVGGRDATRPRAHRSLPRLAQHRGRGVGNAPRPQHPADSGADEDQLGRGVERGVEHGGIEHATCGAKGAGHAAGRARCQLLGNGGRAGQSRRPSTARRVRAQQRPARLATNQLSGPPGVLRQAASACAHRCRRRWRRLHGQQAHHAELRPVRRATRVALRDEMGGVSRGDGGGLDGGEGSREVGGGRASHGWAIEREMASGVTPRHCRVERPTCVAAPLALMPVLFTAALW